MTEETLQARWDVDFPEDCDAAAVCTLLDQGRLYDWNWDDFIWDLPYLNKLLAERPAVFDYLFVTRFLTARASHLLMNGPFMSGVAEVWGEVARQKLQYAGLYRHLFVDALRGVLAPAASGGGRFANRMFVTKIQEVEHVFLRMVEAICLMPESAADFAGYPVGCWVLGGVHGDSGCELLLPPPVAVAVDVEEAHAFRKIRPCKLERAGLIIQNRKASCFREVGCRITSTDRDLQRMCRVEAEGCAGDVRYEEDHFGYYRTIANAAKDELLVVCGNRTLTLIQAGEARPGTCPTRIYPGIAGGNSDEHVYLVDFDNGVSDFFRIEVRAHSGEEALMAPTHQFGKKKPVGATRRAEVRDLKTEVGGQMTDTGDGRFYREDAKGTKREEGQEPDPRVVIDKDYKRIVIDSQEIVFGRKYKRRKFLEFLHKRKLATGEAEFCYDHAKEDYAAATGTTLDSERLDDDLFKGQPKEFRLLFKVVNRKKKIYRLLI